MIGPYFYARYYSHRPFMRRKVTVNGRIRTVSFDLGLDLVDEKFVVTMSLSAVVDSLLLIVMLKLVVG
jgi:hypothetical protein